MLCAAAPVKLTVLAASNVPQVGMVVPAIDKVALAATFTVPVTASPDGIVKLTVLLPLPILIKELEPETVQEDAIVGLVPLVIINS